MTICLGYSLLKDAWKTFGYSSHVGYVKTTREALSYFVEPTPLDIEIFEKFCTLEGEARFSVYLQTQCKIRLYIYANFSFSFSKVQL